MAKRRILEVYLNIASSATAHTAPKRRERFFHKPPAATRVTMPPWLAAVLPNPQRLSAAAPSRYVQHRREWDPGIRCRHWAS